MVHKIHVLNKNILIIKLKKILDAMSRYYIKKIGHRLRKNM